jgi:hypothetical protein
MSSNESAIIESLIRKDVQRSYHALILRYYSGIHLGLRKTTKILSQDSLLSLVHREINAIRT